MDKKPNRQVVIGISVIAGICLLACIGVGVAIMNVPKLLQWAVEQSALEIGVAAPDFELTDLDGKTVHLSQFHGKPVLLTFGATWCSACRASTPHVQQAHEDYPGLVVLLVDMEEDPQLVSEYADDFGLTYPVLLDFNGKVTELYKVSAIPTEVFIDAGGIIRAVFVGSLSPEILAENLPLIGVVP
jgi:thiol-disulfide isomerase/thioredoxin